MQRRLRQVQLFTIRVLGLGGGLRLERLAVTLVVDGLHPEHVVVAVLQPADGALGDVGVGPRADHPAARVLVHLLHDVARDGFPAVVLGGIPLQVAASGGYIRHGEWAW